MKRTRIYFCLLFLMLLRVSEGWAQFNPVNPQEPSIQYKIELECTPEGIAWLYGSGTYSDGSTVNISSYCYNGSYEFQYWECDGKEYSKNSSFRYKMTTADVKFIAHYQYKPDNPAEPNAHFMRRIYLNSQPENIASFNIYSGEKFELGSLVPIFETRRQTGYEFEGWYEGDKLVSDKVDFDYTVLDQDVTLVAHYVFNPFSPTQVSSPDIDTYIKVYDLLGREIDPGSIEAGTGTYIVREFINGSVVRTRKVIR